MAITYVVTEIKEIPKKYRDKCLKIREDTQEIVNNIGDVFVNFFKENYLYINHLAYHILPKEVYLLEKRNLTKKEIQRIEERKR